MHCKPRFVDSRRGSMFALWTRFTSWLQEEKGASMVEYALLVVLIAIVALVGVRLAGTEVSETFSEIGSGLS
jgi:pilus assembly protein Flp/PilA